MKIDVSSAYMSRNILQKMKRGEEILDWEIVQYEESAGIQFLKQHCSRYGGLELNQEVLKQILKHPNQCGVFGEAVILGMEKLDDIDLLLNVNLYELEDEITQKVQNYSLVDVSTLDITIYLLYGIRGTAIVLPENALAIDLCDDSLFVNGRLESSRIIDVLAHEYHHICFDQYVKEHGTRDKTIADSILNGLISEGMAYEFFTPWLIKEGGHESIWDKNYIGIEENIVSLEKVLKEETDKGQLEKIENELFGSGLLGYTMGYHMIHRIHKKLGKNSVLDLMNTYNIFEVYRSLYVQLK